MCSILLVICLFSGIIWNFAVSEVQFSIEELNDNSLSCKQTQEKPGETIALENDYIKLSVTFEGRKPNNSPGINSFQCFKKDDPTSVFVQNPEKSPRNSVTSIKATKKMSSLWKCRILTNEGIGIKPVTYDKEEKKNFTELFCHVNVHVRLLETPQTVLVNNMILPTERMDYTEEDVDRYAVYNYLNGDEVTVACILGSNILKEDTVPPYTIEFQYNYAENLDNMFKELKTTRTTLGYGFRTKLQAQHHNTVMICKCQGQNNHTTIKVTFVQQQKIESNGYITVNGLIARPIQGTKNDNHFTFNYLFFKDEHVEIVCKSHHGFSAAGKQEECKTGNQTYTRNPKTPFEYKCLLCDDNNVLANEINVITKSFAPNFKENKRLDVDLPRDNILLELFNYKEMDRHSWIYYEFEEGKKVELKCIYSKDENSKAEMVVKYFFNKKEFKESKQVTLTSEDDNKYFECLLMEAMDPHDYSPMIYKNITVLFRKRPVVTITTPSTSSTSEIVRRTVVVEAVNCCFWWESVASRKFQDRRREIFENAREKKKENGISKV
ncbi:unnamed protein product [Arctia plantaginis]|uniref:Ig-like domain-containing protein n=1 Tax=Arctia plantaginis TaxID=874455 RepID=A0A8S0ZVD1_ARCPL|nr:unnamed protein product [Arctia plantaginis]